jgi:hypothetical protein
MEKNIVFQQIMLEQVQSYTWKNEFGSLLNIIYKNLIKKDQRPNCVYSVYGSIGVWT